MANIPGENVTYTRNWGAANTIYHKATGTGTSADPFLPEVSIGGHSDVVLCTAQPVLDTAQYSNNDLLASTSIALSGAVRTNGGTAVLESITIIDKDAQGAAMTVLIADRLTDYGTHNAAPSADDDTVAQTLACIAFAAADYLTVAGVKIATKSNLGIVCKADGSANYFGLNAVIGASTPTYTASGLIFKVGFRER